MTKRLPSRMNPEVNKVTEVKEFYEYCLFCNDNAERFKKKSPDFKKTIPNRISHICKKCKSNGRTLDEILDPTKAQILKEKEELAFMKRTRKIDRLPQKQESINALCKDCQSTFAYKRTRQGRSNPRSYCDSCIATKNRLAISNKKLNDKKALNK